MHLVSLVSLLSLSRPPPTLFLTTTPSTDVPTDLLCREPLSHDYHVSLSEQEDQYREYSEYRKYREYREGVSHSSPMKNRRENDLRILLR